MPKYRITAPDGKQYDIEGNGTAQEALAHFQAQYQAQQAPPVPQLAPQQPQQPPQPQIQHGPSPLVTSNPMEYDPSSPEFKAKYGQSLMDSVKAGLAAAPGAIKSTLLGALQGGTFNLGDEMAAGAAMADQRDLPLSQQTINSPEEYQARNQQVLDASRRQLADAAKEHPYLTTVGNLAGGTALGSNLAEGGLTLAGRATTIPQAIGYGALEGAAYGGAYGAGAGNTAGERLTQAGKGAALGGATGAVTGGISAYAASKGVKLPTTDELKDKSQAAYKVAEDAGVALTPDASEALANKVGDSLAKANIHPRIHGKAYDALQDLKERAKSGLTLAQLDQQRQLFRDAAMTSDAGNNRVAKIGIQAIDQAVKDLQPSELASGDQPAALAALSQARKAWSQYSKAQTLDDLMNIADVKGNQYSVSGRENAVRSQFQSLYTSLVRNKAEAAMWSPEEIQAIKQVAMGTNTGKALRLLGKLAFRGPVSGSATVAGYVFGGPIGAAAIAGAGEVGRYGALLSRLRQADLAQQLIRTGQIAPLAIGAGTSGANAGLAAALNQNLPPGGGVLSKDEQRRIAERLRNARAAGL